jgi:hypothetical protein
MKIYNEKYVEPFKKLNINNIMMRKVFENNKDISLA